jgi:hypothetical protein
MWLNECKAHHKDDMDVRCNKYHKSIEIRESVLAYLSLSHQTNPIYDNERVSY